MIFTIKNGQGNGSSLVPKCQVMTSLCCTPSEFLLILACSRLSVSGARSLASLVSSFFARSTNREPGTGYPAYPGWYLQTNRTHLFLTTRSKGTCNLLYMRKPFPTANRFGKDSHSKAFFRLSNGFSCFLFENTH